ncbi:MAG: hypothetical protein KDC98_19500 [Planctomycetes bacterium]|nr:hypothetical protein [Planctomycetota bacterium]
MFERRSDIEFFLEGIGEAVERGWIEVHAYSVLTTHFHALVRSPNGELSRALHHIQLRYVRHFNRRRRRDGPLVRGRFRSKLVDSEAYRRVLVGYIDANAPHACLAATAADYEFCSCRAYVGGTGPDWLSRYWIHAEVCATAGLRSYDGGHYADTFLRGFTTDHRRLVEKRIDTVADDSDPVDLLIGEAPNAVVEWLRYKARLADGTRPGLPLVPAAAVTKVMRVAPTTEPAGVPARLRNTDWRHALTALLLRDLAGLTFAEIGAHLDCALESARQLVIRARTALAADEELAARVADHARAALAATYHTARTARPRRRASLEKGSGFSTPASG